MARMAERPQADGQVRVAWAADAEGVGRVQARAWTASYGDLLPAALLAQVDAAGFAEVWRAAITRPPSARHRVLVALRGDEVVGFAAVAPSEDPDAGPWDGEVVALHVDPAVTREGHGSRLLSAAAETLRQDRFRYARAWLIASDDPQRAFFGSAGWAPDGAHRELDLRGDGAARLRQVRLHTDLGQEE
jgi:ribosomal protein S18 acetylase RimI-like enzyme